MAGPSNPLAYKSVTGEKRRKFFIPPGIEHYTFAFMKFNED
jgi:hypothetical protein